MPRRRLPAVLLLAALVASALALAPAPRLTDAQLAALPESVPAGADWYETFISTPDGESLHVDVMHPAGFDPATDEPTPVILVASPYLGEGVGPSSRFNDFFEGASVFDAGYSVVMVSLRGTGGSTGCLDILGPGEQTDVVTAVTWAASQPWSTGRVAMYGKSYDANTGALGAALQPPGLAAVIAQQIAPDRYRGSYADRVRLAQSLLYPSVTYGVQGEGGFSSDDDPQIIANSVSRGADCQVLLAEHYLDDETAPFWQVRDFVDRAEGSTVPTFITTGYLDAATNIGAGAVDLFNALQGPKRLWIGWWDHVRGNDTVAGDQLAMGREGFFDEVMRFLDEHVKGVAGATAGDPIVAAQDATGTWREELAFPAPDTLGTRMSLLPGTYEDDGQNQGSRDTGVGAGGLVTGGVTGQGTWTFSTPLDAPLHVAGIPSASIDVVPVAPRTNVAVNVYDVSPDGMATMITRGVAMTDAEGTEEVALFPTDWVFPAGHRVGVLVSGANSESFVHVPTNTTVSITGGLVDLPYLPVEREPVAGYEAARMRTYLTNAPFAVTLDTITERTHPTYTPPSTAPR